MAEKEEIHAHVDEVLEYLKLVSNFWFDDPSLGAYIDQNIAKISNELKEFLKYLDRDEIDISKVHLLKAIEHLDNFNNVWFNDPGTGAGFTYELNKIKHMLNKIQKKIEEFSIEEGIK